MFYIDIAQQYRSPKTIVVFSRPETEIVWRICHIFLNRSYSFYLDFFKKPCFYLREPFHSFFPLLKLRGVGGFMLLKFGQRGGSSKNCWEIGRLLERGRVLLFPLILIFNYNFMEILLLMMFISIFLSLKTSNILKNKSLVFERSDYYTLLYIMIFIVMNWKFK